MRLINANKLVDMLYDNEFAVLCPLDEVTGVVDACPTVDAEVVVRCKDCDQVQHCKFGQYLGLDGYCSLGEKRTATMPPKIILDLCGGTGSWSRPWQLNGYDVRIITLSEYDVLTYEPPDNVWGILAAPPCTEFSVLNCIAENRERDFDAGMEIVNACLRIIEQCKPQWWALENPRGHLRDFLGNPKMTFQPWEYGDPWTKATDIWGEFNIPPKLYSKWDDVPNKLPLYQRKGRSKPNFAFLHKSAWKDIPQLAWHGQPTTDAELRAMTSPGFAGAFCEANKEKMDEGNRC